MRPMWSRKIRLFPHGQSIVLAPCGDSPAHHCRLRHPAVWASRRYAEVLALAKARHAAIPPAFRIEDPTLARTVTAGAHGSV